MRVRILRLIPAAIFTCLVLTRALSAQMDAAKIYKTNCELCHGTDGSGNTGTGKAMHARDLRSDETQKQSDSKAQQIQNPLHVTHLHRTLKAGARFWPLWWELVPYLSRLYSRCR